MKKKKNIFSCVRVAFVLHSREKSSFLMKNIFKIRNIKALQARIFAGFITRMAYLFGLRDLHLFGFESRVSQYGKKA
jgi:hypothetical protein